MIHRVIVTGPAKRDIQADHDWWAKHRSAEQAARWYLGIHAAMESLARMPERCPAATEHDLLPQGVRQLLYGLGQRRTHRIVFGSKAMTSSCFGCDTRRRMRSLQKS